MISAVVCVLYPCHVAGGGDGMSFQLASLEEHAVVHLWVSPIFISS